MMLAIEEMQTQVRAENGIKERIIGYLGSDWEPELEELNSVDFDSAGFKKTDFKDLPQDIQDVIEAENQRLKTGEVITIDEFKRRKGV